MTVKTIRMATKSPGSRRRYNDKIMGHQERAAAYDTEFELTMRSVQNIRTLSQPDQEGQPVTLIRYVSVIIRFALHTDKP